MTIIVVAPPPTVRKKPFLRTTPRQQTIYGYHSTKERKESIAVSCFVQETEQIGAMEEALLCSDTHLRLGVRLLHDDSLPCCVSLHVFQAALYLVYRIGIRVFSCGWVLSTVNSTSFCHTHQRYLKGVCPKTGIRYP